MSPRLRRPAWADVRVWHGFFGEPDDALFYWTVAVTTTGPELAVRKLESWLRWCRYYFRGAGGEEAFARPRILRPGDEDAIRYADGRRVTATYHPDPHCGVTLVHRALADWESGRSTRRPYVDDFQEDPS